MEYSLRQTQPRFGYANKSLRFAVAALYILIVMLAVADGLIAKFTLMEGMRGEVIFIDLPPLNWSLLGSGFLFLILLEWLESYLYPRRLHILTRLLFIGLKLTCVVVISMVDPSNRSIYLWPLILYTLHFYFGVFSVLPILTLIVLEFLFIDANYSGSSILEISSLLIMFVFAIIIKRDEQMRERNLELYRELESYAALSASVAKQDERDRISRDLHDTLGHYLAGMNIQLQKAAAYRSINEEESITAINLAQQASTDAMRELRQTLSDLREIEEETVFEDQIDKLVTQLRANGLNLTCNLKGSSRGYSELILMTIQKVIQEALNNVLKHAGTEHSELSIEFGRRNVTVIIADDGIGFSRREIDEQKSFGLRGLQERVDLVSGKLVIKSRQGEGTTLQVILPKRLAE